MDTLRELKEKVLNAKRYNFEELALEIFRFQASQNEVYSSYLQYLKVQPRTVRHLEQVPFLPIEFFKRHRVFCKGLNPVLYFESSGTTGSNTSRHYLSDPDFYRQVCSNIFQYFYGDLRQYHLFALLPSYLERQHSSLVFMARHFAAQAAAPSGFFLHNQQELAADIANAAGQGGKVLLLGVTFALLDFARDYPAHRPKLLIMETGGMKGRRKEMVREEVHESLCSAFAVPAIHSEYGMTELLSQFYSKALGVFEMSPWARILLRDITDPFSYEKHGKTGGINVVDLANIESCSFIQTMDLGTITRKGAFKVTGRFDTSDLRGCNLMIS